ncbi:MAG: DUF899 family protein [Mucilaginibacter polytrichastri]|nr:DUF899 family protein [Mucilaginibacter polytrichastri]
MSAITFPNESAEYRAARNTLFEKEKEMRRMAEDVAALRRRLPRGGEVPEDYVFQGDGPVTLSELFEPGKDTLAIYSYMFGPNAKSPCMMCTPLLDGLNGVSAHLNRRISFVVVAQSPVERLRAFKNGRGWDIRLISAAGNNYNRDYHGTNSRGQDDTILNVFQKIDGKVYHFWGSELSYDPMGDGMDHRSLDSVNPIFMMFDLTPEGRGDFYTSVTYPY